MKPSRAVEFFWQVSPCLLSLVLPVACEVRVISPLLVPKQKEIGDGARSHDPPGHASEAALQHHARDQEGHREGQAEP